MQADQNIIMRYHTALDGTESMAAYSACEQYRYVLARRWVPRHSMAKTLVMVMLNPSTATEAQNDPTVERCERRARMWGFESLRVLNLFALRSTDPKGLAAVDDPIGPANNGFLKDALGAVKENAEHMILCGWGTHGAFMDRGRWALDLFAAHGMKPMALGWTKDGHPQHPLYIGYDQKPRGRDEI